MMGGRGAAAALLALGLIAGCDGPREDAGEKADVATGAADAPIDKGPQERLGEIQDRTARDRARAVEATADQAEDRADELRTDADRRADELERQAEALRDGADRSGEALDQKAEAIRRTE